MTRLLVITCQKILRWLNLAFMIKQTFTKHAELRSPARLLWFLFYWTCNTEHHSISTTASTPMETDNLGFQTPDQQPIESTSIQNGPNPRLDPTAHKKIFPQFRNKFYFCAPYSNSESAQSGSQICPTLKGWPILEPDLLCSVEVLHTNLTQLWFDIGTQLAFLIASHIHSEAPFLLCTAALSKEGISPSNR